MKKLHIKEFYKKGKKITHLYFGGADHARIVTTDLKTGCTKRTTIQYRSAEAAAHHFQKAEGHSWTDPVKITGEYYQQKSPTY